MLNPLEIFFFLLNIEFLFASSAFSTNRTIPCSITEHNNSVVFDCEARGLIKVPFPTNYTSDYVELMLGQNLIDAVYKPSFQRWKNLTKIDLIWNHYPMSKLNNNDTCKRGLEIDNETFANLTKLKYLYIDHNYLCEVPSILPDSIQELSLQYNNIKSVNQNIFSRFKNLEMLNLGHNCYYGNICNGQLIIENKTFSDLEQLKVLNLASNSLTSVPLNLPSSLTELDLSNNQIEVVHNDTFKNLVHLEVLALSGNCARCFNAKTPCKPCPGKGFLEIDDTAFWNLKSLRELYLASTSLVTIPKALFENSSQLKVLDLQKNYLSGEMAIAEFVSYLPALEALDLSWNYIPKTYSKTINISNNFSKLVSLSYLGLQGYVFKSMTSNSLAPLTKLNNLTTINLSVNFISQVDFKALEKIPSLTVILMSNNRITPFSENTSEKFSNDQIKINLESAFRHNVADVTTISPDYNTTLSKLVKPQCSVYGKTLDLSLNSIFFINPEEFQPFSDVACLNLSSNGLGQNLNGTEFIYLKKLAYLDLSFNKLDFGSTLAFQELENLEVLDLSYNKHYFIVEDVTHHLRFIENLYKLTVLNLSWNEISMLTDCQISSYSLKELRFSGNRLNALWKKGDQRFLNLFKNITNLSVLDISYNRLHQLPDDLAFHLPSNLTELYLHNNGLEFFDWKFLRCFRRLKHLDLSHNKITMITVQLSGYTESLETLIISHNYIQALADAFLIKLKSLSNLDLSYNNIQHINHSAFASGKDNYLKVLNLKANPFECSCNIIDLLNWINYNNVTIPRLATDVTCATPDKWQKQGIILFDVNACSVDFIALLYFILSFVLIVSFTALPVLSYLFYWDLWYTFHWCMAMQKYSKLHNSESIYDAFIMYDEKDISVSDWVVNELCCQLEHKGDKHVHLCLEERDWEPGKAVIDNIAQSINLSNKTLFVLTKDYVKTGKFKTAFYLAMQKLMDENMDVIVIVLLQPVLQHSQYLKLRKKICKSSILEWPKNPHAQSLFWQKMKHVLLTENISRYNNLYINMITGVR
ncbi:toll-like receptor 8 [Hyperolius riggenbachi]|uniref:toll-like receptor 8 n=1 Tax=Hyperolius riggenbachi TaxID=752182 RepID=UPI0035A26FFD